MVVQRAVRVLVVTALILAMVPGVPLAAGAASSPGFPLCTADYQQQSPRIDGERVIWVDDRNGGYPNADIYLFDFATGEETQLTTTTIEQDYAEISGDWIAYSENDGTYANSSIKALNVVTMETRDVWVGHSGWSQRPKIDGDIIVWEFASNVGSDGFDVLGYDIGTDSSFVIAGGGGDQRDPVIGGGKVIYDQGSAWYSYDLATTDIAELLEVPSGVSTLCTAADDQHWVFIASPGEGPDYLYAMDLATSEVETLTTSVEPYGAGDFHVDVDGDTVVFSAEPPGPYFKSYAYSLASGTDQLISSYDSEQYQPHVSGSTIVWRDGRNYPGSGNNYTDIYTNRATVTGPVPTTTASGIPVGWATYHPVEVSLEASPSAGSTVYYRIDGAGPYTYSDVIGFDNAGSYELEYWAQSAAGREDTKTATIRLDWTAPTTEEHPAMFAGYTDVSLDPVDAHSGVRDTYWRIDGSVWRRGTEISTSVLGSHELEYYSVDHAGNRETTRVRSFTVNPLVTKLKSPVEGTDRFKTAVAASLEAFPDGIVVADYEGYRTAVVATGNNWPDALGAASLAGALGGPILLTDSGVLPSAVRTEIGRLGADRVIIIGGSSAVSEAVRGAIDALPGVAVERISGANRYETARKVAARAVLAQGSAYDGNAIITTGDNFPDALAGSPVAAHTGWPIYLMGQMAFDPATADQMEADGVTHVYLLGGTTALPAFVESTIEARTGITVDPADRIAGGNRYQTAARVAQMGVDDAGLFWDDAALATGDAFPDALAGGVMQGRLGSVVLLTTPKALHAEAEAKLVANRSRIDEIRFLGGTSALSQSVRNRAWQVIQ